MFVSAHIPGCTCLIRWFEQISWSRTSNPIMHKVVWALDYFSNFLLLWFTDGKRIWSGIAVDHFLVPMNWYGIIPEFSSVQNSKNQNSVQFSHSVVSNSLLPHGLQHVRPPCSSPTPRVYSNSCPLSRWCHPTISSSVIPFSSPLQSFPASESFQMSQLFVSGGRSIKFQLQHQSFQSIFRTDFL